MILGELATNAVKHGALGARTGTVRISTSPVSDTMHQIEWAETVEGATVSAPSGRVGFGSRILNKIGPRSFGGKAATEYTDTGLTYRLTMDPAIVFVKS